MPRTVTAKKKVVVGSTEALQACPFCDSPAEYVRLWFYVDKKGKHCMPRVDGSAEHGRVRCTSCGAATRTGSPAEVVKLWHQRPTFQPAKHP